MKNRIINIFLFMILIQNYSCDKFKDIESGTPEEIVVKAAKFYNEKNPEKFLRLLSESAVKKMDRSLQALRMQFKTLDVQYRKDLAEKMSMDPNSLINLKMADYIKFNMNLNSGMGSDNILFPVHHVSASDFVGSEIKEDKAIVTYKETVIHLVKENKFWKIKTFDILHKKNPSTENSPE